MYDVYVIYIYIYICIRYIFVYVYVRVCMLLGIYVKLVTVFCNLWPTKLTLAECLTENDTLARCQAEFSPNSGVPTRRNISPDLTLSREDNETVSVPM